MVSPYWKKALPLIAISGAAVLAAGGIMAKIFSGPGAPRTTRPIRRGGGSRGVRTRTGGGRSDANAAAVHLRTQTPFGTDHGHGAVEVATYIVGEGYFELPWLGLRIEATPHPILTDTFRGPLIGPANCGLITVVYADSPADYAGFRPGECVKSIRNITQKTSTVPNPAHTPSYVARTLGPMGNLLGDRPLSFDNFLYNLRVGDQLEFSVYIVRSIQGQEEIVDDLLFGQYTHRQSPDNVKRIKLAVGSFEPPPLSVQSASFGAYVVPENTPDETFDGGEIVHVVPGSSAAEAIPLVVPAGFGFEQRSEWQGAFNPLNTRDVLISIASEPVSNQQSIDEILVTEPQAGPVIWRNRFGPRDRVLVTIVRNVHGTSAYIGLDVMFGAFPQSGNFPWFGFLVQDTQTAQGNFVQVQESQTRGIQAGDYITAVRDITQAVGEWLPISSAAGLNGFQQTLHPRSLVEITKNRRGQVSTTYVYVQSRQVPTSLVAQLLPLEETISGLGLDIRPVWPDDIVGGPDSGVLPSLRTILYTGDPGFFVENKAQQSLGQPFKPGDVILAMTINGQQFNLRGPDWDALEQLQNVLQQSAPGQQITVEYRTFVPTGTWHTESSILTVWGIPRQSHIIAGGAYQL